MSLRSADAPILDPPKRLPGSTLTSCGTALRAESDRARGILVWSPFGRSRSSSVPHGQGSPGFTPLSSPASSFLTPGARCA